MQNQKYTFSHSTSITPEDHAAIKNQKPLVLWFTGLPGSGKSTISNLVEVYLHKMGKHTFSLDGDNVRHGLSSDLGFSKEDRTENTRRVAEVAKLMTEGGLIVLVSLLSPFRDNRALARSLFPPGKFFEIFIDTPIEECEARDPKGLYAKAKRGELSNFTGISSPYEPPLNPDIHIFSGNSSPEQCALKVMGAISHRI